MYNIGNNLTLSLHVSKGVPSRAQLCYVFLGESDANCSGQEVCGLVW